MTLKEFFLQNNKVALGFSGGVDSSYLFYEAVQNNAYTKAYFVKTAFQPAFELNDAKRIAEQLGAEMTIIEADILVDDKISSNPADRCYYCKLKIFSELQKQAIKDGCKLMIDGSNASDDEDDRPGMKALKELSVRSPLRECGITKAQVRRLSQEAGLFTWDKPAYACLATRIPTGQVITTDILTRIEAAEDRLFGLGFSDFRVRAMGNDIAKLQVPESQIKDILSKHSFVLSALEPYFKTVLLDMRGR